MMICKFKLKEIQEISKKKKKKKDDHIQVGRQMYILYVLGAYLQPMVSFTEEFWNKSWVQ